MPPPPLAALLALTAAAAASAGVAVEALPGGCLHGGRWFVQGASVAVRAACLRCRCARGALACARTACRASPDPPPGCHLRHRREACCPELHCPDGVTVLEHGASARLDDDLEDAIPASAGHVCVEDGTAFGAGSALAARAACEQCYCLAGRRRCVRPRCLPPPPGCRPRPAPGACCPQRYYCDPPAAAAAAPDNHTSPHDCEVNGAWVSEGARVPAAPAEAACAHCFCLRGAVRCQPLACAPPLAGCAPVTLPGQCCPHMYRCNHSQETLRYLDPPISHNALVSARNEDRSLDTSKLKIQETATKILSSSSVSTKSVPTESSTKTQYVSTSKVKRKTNDAPPSAATQKAKQTVTNATVQPTTTTKAVHKQTTKLATTVSTTSTSTSTTTEAPTTASTEAPTSQPSTAQPDGTVRIMINGTINCTAELSHSPLNRTVNETDREKQDAVPRIPFVAERIEAQTASSVEIITDRNVNGGFDENETFTINVTSSLRTNQSHTTAPPLTAASESVPEDMSEAVNVSKKNKEDYDYDYAEPTLPPSLPNLKIIPFVAADAVVDEDTSVKEHLSYPALEREDKFPVYYPSKESEPPAPAPALFATRREDAFPANPVFPPAADAHAHNHLAASLHELTVSAALDTRVPEPNKFTKPPSAFTKFELTMPKVNLFSPPVETEGGFIPKGPGIIDEYYAVYPSTHVPPSLPHLTTSMQLDTGKGECYTHDGRLVRAGASLTVACAACACARGRLQCAPRACPAPTAGCRRRPVGAGGSDLCCGDLLCDHDNKTTTTQLPELSTRRTEITLNVSKVPVEIPSDVIPFDPPPDRREPVTDRAVTDKDVKVEEKHTEKGNDQETTTTSSKTNIVAENGTRSNNNETVEQRTSTKISTPSTTTEKSTTVMYNLTDKIEAGESAEVNDTSNQSQEYEDEEDDEGFSFGSVLKLLLSDSYDATAAPPPPPPRAPPVTPAPTTKPPTTTTTAAPKLYTTTRKILPKPVAAFIPMPNHHYVPPKKAYQPNTINRIDHLVLGEATAIRKPTARPVSATPRPATTSFKPNTRPSSPRPVITTRHPVTNMEEHRNPSSSVSYEVGRPPAPALAAPPGAGVGGLLKLAGCNIYGQMYRVGRIITELSTPCEECRCTELGVTCRPLPC